jgi:flagellar biosynthesis chaperone FliJ
MQKAKLKITDNAAKRVQHCREKIDNYNNTVYAIIGFLNTYVHELRRKGDLVVIFQGRKLYFSANSEQFVTPDLGITIGNDMGIVGEVKCTLDKDQNNWKDHFKQLKKYEKILVGWPTENGNVAEFDIVLLVEHSRSRALKDFYEKNLEGDLKLTKPFIIIEFNRSSQQKEFFFFRIEYGNLSNEVLHRKFYDGINVAMEVFVKQYSRIKIYDVEPEMPIMLQLINECVVDKQIRDRKYKKLTRRNTQPVEISVHEITDLLKEAYSFRSLHNPQYKNNQPEFPKTEWVRKAFDKLVELAEGNWLDKGLGKFNYLLSQKEGNILDHYILRLYGDVAIQTRLFE